MFPHSIILLPGSFFVDKILVNSLINYKIIPYKPLDGNEDFGLVSFEIFLF
jgi:hypothetical protein